MLNDLRFALRTLCHNPGFALAAIVSLALGIGANAAIFSLAEYILLRPLPVPDPYGVMVVQSQFQGESLGNIFKYTPVSYPDFEDLRKKSHSFEGLAASQYFQFGFAPQQKAQPQMRFGVLVSGNFFDVLGAHLQLGQGLRGDEDKVPGRDAVVVLGHHLWKNELASDPGVVGRTIFLDGLPFTVVGVAPESFIGPSAFVRADLYVPLAMQPTLTGVPGQSELERREERSLIVQGRLKPGLSIRQAAAEVRVIGQQLAQAYPKTNRTCSLIVTSYRQWQMIPQILQLVLLLSGLAAVVLLIACANVMNLMLSRASARSREIAVRLAMGVGRWRLVRQLLTESLVIAILGGGLGLVLAQLGAQEFSQVRIPLDIPIVVDVKLDPQVLLFALLVSVVSAILVGLAPALKSTQTELVPALKAGRTGDGRQRLLGRHVLVMAQVAGSLLLLVVASQAYRGARILLSSPAGFRTDHLLTASFNPSLARDSEEQTREFYRQLLEKARLLPGVKSAALSQAMPMVPSSGSTRVIPEGVPLPVGTEAVTVFSNVVSDGYFRTLNLPLVLGRELAETDRADTARVVIVNEEFASKYYPNHDALGKRLRLYGVDGPFVEIVGVAKQSKYVFPIESPMDYLYLPLSQNPVPAMTLMLETAGASAELSGPLRDMVRSLDSRQPIFGVRTMEEFYDVRAHKTFAYFVDAIAGLGVLGLVLALVGLYSLMTYSVSLRDREIGIRMAVGADSGNVVRMVLRQGMILAGGGAIIGLSLSLAASKPLAGLVQGLGFNLPLVGLVTVALLGMAALGAYVPARRASRVDPNAVLRQE